MTPLLETFERYDAFGLRFRVDTDMLALPITIKAGSELRGLWATLPLAEAHARRFQEAWEAERSKL